MVRNIRHLNYTDRMKDLGLPSLQYRRTRADLIEVFKIINGIDKCDKDQLFRMQTDQRTRGHTQKLFKRQFRLDLRKYSFSQRVILIDDWNSLPEDVVSSGSINQFKSRLNKFRISKTTKLDKDKNKEALFNVAFLTDNISS